MHRCAPFRRWPTPLGGPPRTLLSTVLSALLTALLLLPAAEALAADERVSILTYNLGNLFDTNDAPHRDDNTFLPMNAKRSAHHRRHCASLQFDSWRRRCLKLDWNARHLAGKIRALAQVLHSARATVLVLQEVENAALLNRLVGAMPNSGLYRTRVLIEGDDPRGIDQAVVSSLPLAGRARLLRGPDLPRRGILEVPLVLPRGGTLRVFAVHMPAAYHPIKERLRMLRRLHGLATSRLAAGPVAIAGDFNLTAEDGRHRGVAAIERHWLQVHERCRGSHLNCAGTHYFGGTRQWSWLDRIWLPPTMAPDGDACWRLRPESVSVVRTVSGQLTPSGYPRPYLVRSGLGASDHLPLRAELQWHCGR